MKVTFWCNSGANIHSENSETLDVVKDWGLEPGEWEAMDEEQKYKIAEEWAWNNGLQIGFTEEKDE